MKKLYTTFKNLLLGLCGITAALAVFFAVTLYTCAAENPDFSPELEFDLYEETDALIYASGNKPVFTMEVPPGMKGFAEVEKYSGGRSRELRETQDRMTLEFEEGRYSILPYLEDEGGNKIYAEGFPVTFLYDSTPPERVDFEIEMPGNGMTDTRREDCSIFAADTVTLRVKAEDALSGIKGIFLEWDGESKETDSAVIDSGTCGAIGARCVDLCGNESPVYICDYSIMVDRSAPVIELKHKENDDGVSFTAILEDTASGLKNVRVSWEDEVLREKDFTLNHKKVEKEELTFDVTGDMIGREEGELSVFLQDCAGNDRRVTARIRRRDDDKPVILISGIRNGGVSSEPVALSVDIEDGDIDRDSIEIKAVRQGITGSGEYSFDPGDSFVFYEDGMYEFMVRAADRSGNTAEERLVFTVDSTPPVITGLEKYKGKQLSTFSLAGDMADMFSDVTLVQYHLYLNGRDFMEYEEIDEPGSYEVEVMAADQAGNIGQDSAFFEIPGTMAPEDEEGEDIPSPEPDQTPSPGFFSKGAAVSSQGILPAEKKEAGPAAENEEESEVEKSPKPFILAALGLAAAALILLFKRKIRH